MSVIIRDLIYIEESSVQVSSNLDYLENKTGETVFMHIYLYAYNIRNC